MNILVGAAIFITVVFVIEGIYFAVRTLHNPERKQMRRRLQALSSGRSGSEDIDIVRRRVLSQVPWLNAILMRVPGMQALGRILEQSDSRYPLGVFLLLSVFLAVMGLWLGSWVLGTVLFQLLGAAGCGVMPFLYVYHKKRRRSLQFQKQLPEALDLVARALRAGHTFQAGMKMVGQEFSDPISAEFEKTLAEINFGAGVPEALKNLSQRVDCPDLNFFVISIIVQRETGGNLAEIADNIAHLIRKRFELQDRIRVLSAEGKLSAIVLLALPVFVGLAVSFLSPTYLEVLFTDPVGKGMLGSAALMMLLGTLVIKKMIHIKV
ncbi:MAG: type II secretion system F family protein [Nitrospinae bacterium]|nr:type II secretion system F family protein [Nitrospinota bacterium]